MDAVVKDVIVFLFTRGAPPSTAALEQSWDKPAELAQNVVVKDGIAFLVTCRASPSTAALAQSWDEAGDGQLPLSEVPH